MNNAEPDSPTVRSGLDLGRSRTLTELAATEIRRQVISGQIPAGSKIPVAAIAQELGISAVPVREALQGLQGEGIVTIFGHRGAIAAPASPRELAELYQLRELLEPAAVRSVDLRLFRERLDDLTDALDRLESSLQTGDRESFRTAHEQFHFGIYACADSNWMLRMIKILYDNCERYRTLATWRRDPHDAAHEHREILDALRRADPAEAADVAFAHLQITKTAALSSISEIAVAGDREHGE
jgi:DNA-binding GntR family transcriptional regulator